MKRQGISGDRKLLIIKLALVIFIGLLVWEASFPLLLKSGDEHYPLSRWPMYSRIERSKQTYDVYHLRIVKLDGGVEYYSSRDLYAGAMLDSRFFDITPNILVKTIIEQSKEGGRKYYTVFVRQLDNLVDPAQVEYVEVWLISYTVDQDRQPHFDIEKPDNVILLGRIEL